MNSILKFVIFQIIFYIFANAQIPDNPIRRIRPGRIVRTVHGQVQGLDETYDVFKRLHSFKGIPYARPPIGELRFRSPVELNPWNEIKQTTTFGPNCLQMTRIGNVGGQEDCLYLNIFTPNRIRALLPVVVYIHGGEFVEGSGDTNALGPEFFIEENIIFVSINYRLGVMGFLNTMDQFSPGNYGLKDILFGLRWIQNNIQAFGGNPNDVTIQGFSAGSAAVHAMVLSRAASGLFHKAISQSGSLLNDWAFDYNPRETVERLARRLYMHFSNTQDLVNQLRNISPERLLRAAAIFDKELPQIFERGYFVPSVEPSDSQEIRIITGTPNQMIRSPNVNRTPYLMGFTSIEFIFAIPELVRYPTAIERFTQNPNNLIPDEWNLQPNSPDALEVISAFNNIYFNGTMNSTADFAWRFANYVSDRLIIFGVSKASRIHSLVQNVYYYRFSYSGAFNYFKRLSGLMNYPGAAHGEDLFYLKRLNRFFAPVLPNDQAFFVRSRHVRLFSNFIKFGIPTPVLLDPLINANWPRTTPNVQECMDIGHLMLQQNNPFADRMNMWHAFDKRFSR